MALDRKTGLAADRNAEVEFANVKAPEGMCVARGLEACRAALAWFYLGISASNVGALFACYEILKEWGDNRVIKGRGNVFKDNPLTAAVMAEVLDRYALSPGDAIQGPALVEERESTTVIPPGARAVVDSMLNLVIELP